jgi:hypothetical protein
MASKKITILNPLFFKPSRKGALLFVSIPPWIHNHPSGLEPACAEYFENQIDKTLPKHGTFCGLHHDGQGDVPTF